MGGGGKKTRQMTYLWMTNDVYGKDAKIFTG